MERFGISDELELLGLLVGAFMILVGIGTVVGLPWQTAESALVGVLQVVGGLVAVAVGAALVWIVRTGPNPA
ncbi:hypothetical protein [Halorientalis halophila]|uniref:hypothetical protein n=1 Tax=Halorientalis halophila TaxID=3108499 RepID=UPI00300AEC66